MGLFSLIFGAFFIWRLLLASVQFIADRYVDSQFAFIPDAIFRFHISSSVFSWANFDGLHYLRIAKDGYGPMTQVFFPFYPISIRIIHELFRTPYLISGVLVSHGAFLASLFVFYALLIRDGKKNLGPLFFTVVFLFPTSFYYAAVYTDALFLLFASLCLLCGRYRYWGWSGFFGVLGTLTRLNGITLLFYIFFEYMFEDMVASEVWNMIIHKKKLLVLLHRKIVSASMIRIITSMLSIMAIFVGYLLYIQNRFGDWMLVFRVMKIWHQDHFVFPLQVFWRYLKILLFYPLSQFTYWVALGEFMFVCFYIVVLARAVSHIRISYWIFFFLSLLIPMMTGTFQGMPRYGLHLYPFFLMWTEWLSQKPKNVRMRWLFASFCLLVLYESAYIRGYFVA